MHITRRPSGHRTLAACLLGLGLIAACTLTPRVSEARDIGWIGLSHKMKVDGYFGRGERWGNSGNQFYVQFHAAMFGKGSPMGNLAGIEFDAGVGYDGMGYRENDTILGDMGVPMHIAVGFPVTLFRWFHRGGDRLQIGFSPGFGFNWLSAYTYLKLQAAFRISRKIAVEGVYTWLPGRVSHMWEQGSGVNLSRARANVYFRPKGRGGAFVGFVEVVRSQQESEGPGGNSDKSLFAGKDPFGKTTRVDFEGIMRVGVGYAF